MKFRRPVDRVRSIGYWEGWSFLLLLFVAMPLKYIWSMPQAVTYVGAAHGALYVLFVAVILEGAFAYGWSRSVVAMLLISAVFPFGPFLAEKYLLTDLARLVDLNENTKQ
jgi:integral membrane protein